MYAGGNQKGLTSHQQWVTRANEADPHDVAARLGLQAEGKRYRCPSCGAARTKSDKRGPVGVHNGDRWTCGACSASGRSVDLVGHALRANPVGPETRDWFVREGLVESPGDAPDLRPRPPPPKRPPPARDEPRYPPRDQVERFWREAGRVTDHPAVASWVQSRGLDPATLEERDLLRARPTTSPEWYPFGADYAAMLPLYDPTGALRSVRGRDVSSTRRPKSRNPLGHQVRELVFANAAGVALLQGGELEAGARVYLTEGGPDYLTMASWLSETSPDVVLGLAEGSWSDALAETIAGSGAEVVCLVHADDAGGKYQAKVLASLGTRSTVRVLDPQVADARDLNDRWRADPAAFDPEEGLVVHTSAMPDGYAIGTDIEERPIVMAPFGQYGLELSVGDINLFVGRPGNAKSTLAIQWAAEHSRREGAGKVLVVTEEDVSKATRARYRVMGGRLDRCIFGSRTLAIEELAAFVTQQGVDLIVADPMPSLVHLTESNSNDAVRAAFEELQRQVLFPRNVTIIGLMHTSKATRDTPLDKMLGAGAFGQLARQVYVLGKVEEGDDVYVDVADEKHTYSPRRATVRHRLEPMAEVPGLVRLLEEGTVQRSPDDVMSGRPETTDTVRVWLVETLRNHAAGMTRGELLDLAVADEDLTASLGNKPVSRPTLYRRIKDMLQGDRSELDEATDGGRKIVFLR